MVCGNLGESRKIVRYHILLLKMQGSRVTPQLERYFRGIRRQAAADNHYIRPVVDLKPSDVHHALRQLLTLIPSVQKSRAILTILFAYYCNLR